MVPVVALVGFGLFDRGFPVVGRCVEIGLPMLILFVALSQYFKWIYTRHIPVLERFALLISIAFVWVYAHILTAGGEYKNRPLHTQINCRTDRANLISSAPWIKIPYPLQWGPPTFNAGHCFGMMAAVVVSMVESTGAFKAAARLASATTPPVPVLSRGIGCQGLSILLDGLCGSLTGSSVSVENVELLGSTGVVGGGGTLLFSYLQFTNMNSMRNLFIVGVSLFLVLSVPEYFDRYTIGAQHGPAHTKAGWFNDWINTTFASPPTVALIVAVILDNSLEFREAGRDRGMH
ncbi:Xanthine/uracil permease family protein [Rhynchospora pubera]|uniref:Xanthine/uracil permease family protein n=1 Tax=Rhynchospora pubera TaxID=906938 RepID=A0AAV8GV98_9POAL|nr:Xanthine/uracil permease family protein [Rhynchospora pubera]